MIYVSMLILMCFPSYYKLGKFSNIYHFVLNIQHVAEKVLDTFFFFDIFSL